MRHRLTDPAAIEAAIAAIPLLALDALRRRWRAVFGRIPPDVLNKDMLGRMIACRLQERAFGGLDRESRSGPVSGDPTGDGGAISCSWAARVGSVDSKR